MSSLGSGLLEMLLALPLAATLTGTTYRLDRAGLAVAIVTFVVVELRRRRFAPLTA